MTELTQQHSASDAVGIINANLEALDVDVTLTSEDSASSVCEKLNGAFDVLDEPTELTSTMSASEFIEAVNANTEALEEHDDGVGELTFLHLSDTHGSDAGTNRAAALLAADNSLFCIVSGDTYSHIDAANSSMNIGSSLGGGSYRSRLMMCAGNHDSYPNGTYTSNGLKNWQTHITDLIKTKTTTNIVWGDTDGVNNTPLKSSYGYCDFQAQGTGANRKVRFIILDQYELDAVGIPDDVDKSTDNGGSRYLELYSNKQLDWFIATLKSLNDPETGVDYFAVILHSPPVTNSASNREDLQGARRNNKFIAAKNGATLSGNNWVNSGSNDNNWGSTNGSIWASIVDAYLNKSLLNVDFHNFLVGDSHRISDQVEPDQVDHISMTADFTSTTPVPFLFYVCGHMHREYIGYHPEYPNQLIMAVDTAKGGGDGASDLARTGSGDIVINKVTLNFATRKIIVEREGLGTVPALTVAGKPYGATTREWIQFNFKRKGNEWCDSDTPPVVPVEPDEPDEPVSTEYDAEIEFLQSSGTQYIDTGIVGGSNFECEIKAEYTQNQDGFDTILGAFTSTGHFSVALAIQKVSSSSRPYFQFGSTYVLHTANPLAQHVYKTSLKNGVVKIDIDGSAVTDTYSAELSDLTMYLFARHRGDTTIGNYSKAKVYYCKIWSNGSLVRDYIPVRVGQVGYLYDQVSGELFGNSGSGSFTLGNDITT